MERKSRSILQEISTYIPEKNKTDLVENRANHIITSAINLFETIDAMYDGEEADQLKRRFMSSIRGSDPKRFKRSIQKIKEDKNAS